MPARRHTILVVDDEADVVKSVKDLLRYDYNVLGATKADDGVRLMTENAVDVVMTDQRMPDVTGVEFLKRIKDPHPEATRLLFTGYADIRAVIEAINQGNVYRYVTKPWDPDELQTVIREACERHDMIVQRRTLIDELEKTNVELREANDLKTAFIRVASHELRTPVAILVGYSQLAQRLPSAGGANGDWIARITRAANRLQHLIDQIIAMLGAGDFRTPLRREPTPIVPMIAEAVEDIAPFLELRGHRLVRDWPDTLGTISIDAAQVRDALNQLLLNAIKFTPDGGEVRVSAARDENDHLRLTVADNGRGMDDASLKHFGDAFFTAYDVSHHSSGTFEHNSRGLGLGASLVKKTVEMHGGTLQVQSELNKGTTVTITFPPTSTQDS